MPNARKPISAATPTAIPIHLAFSDRLSFAGWSVSGSLGSSGRLTSGGFSPATSTSTASGGAGENPHFVQASLIAALVSSPQAGQVLIAQLLRARLRTAPRGIRGAVFAFYSNRLGCLPSLLISAGVTVVLLLAFGVIDLGGN